MSSNFAARLVDGLGSGAALIDAPTGEQISGADAARVAGRFASAFEAKGLERGDRVIIICDSTPVSAFAYVGAMYAGFVPVLIDERTSPDSAEAICGRAHARAAWVPLRYRSDLLSLGSDALLRGEIDARRGDMGRPAVCSESDLAVLMPTSGSSGSPRLVQVTHGNLIANTEAIIRSQRLCADDRAMLILPLSYCFGASVLHTHVCQGASVVFDRRFMFPDKVLRAIDEHACTTFAGVPTVYSVLLRRSNLRSIPLPTLRRFLQAGGALAPERVAEMREIVPHAEFFVMYGQTEATSRIASLPPTRIVDKGHSVGPPLDNLTVRVVDESGQDASIDQPGELWVCGKSVSRGYYEDEEATTAKFRNGWLLTGDIVSRDADGFLTVIGRKSEFIKMRGLRVSFAAVEATVNSVRGIVECAADAVPHVEAGEALALYVVPERDSGAVAASIRRCLPDSWVCDSIRFVAELPRNAHGKLDRSRLKQLKSTQIVEWPAPAPPARHHAPRRAGCE